MFENKKTTTLALLCFFLLVSSATMGQLKKEAIFKDYRIKTFSFQGRDAKIVFPNDESEHGQWIWRARFWGHEPQVDKALLDKGFHLVYLDVAGLFGNQEAVKLWNDYYDFLTRTYSALGPKVVLEGLSRGGLIIYNWAAQNLDKVACMYADAPVCDIKSWPGGLYTGVGSQKDWEDCLAAYDLNEQSVQDFKGIPIHTSLKVAEAKIPVIHVYGDSDKVVPHTENTLLVAKNFEKVGGEFKLISKKGIGHHPHSLEDPTPIVDFILKHTLYIK